MAKVTASEIIALGLTREMFRQDSDDALTTLITGVITEQAALLAGAVGSSVYDSESTPIPEKVKRAEKCLSAAEMLRIRKNIRLGDVTGEGKDINLTWLDKQIAAYETEAGAVITALSGCDFSTGVLESSHFEETTELGGLECLT